MKPENEKKTRRVGQAAVPTSASEKMKNRLVLAITENTQEWGSKAKLAKKMEEISGNPFPQTTIRSIERGEYSNKNSNNPGTNTIALLADAMGLEWMLIPKEYVDEIELMLEKMKLGIKPHFCEKNTCDKCGQPIQ